MISLVNDVHLAEVKTSTIQCSEQMKLQMVAVELATKEAKAEEA